MIKNDLEGNISDTACWIAAFRALETDRPDALFRDPYARVLAGKRGEAMIHHMPGGTSTAWIFAIRTQVIDEMILESIQKRQVDTVLNLAAGLDSRPYRLNLPTSLRWIEVDLSPILEYKETCLAGYETRCKLERVALDLSDVEKRRTLFSKINQESKNVFVITEGLLMYLDREMVKSLSTDLYSQSHFRWWVQDFIFERALKFIKIRWNRQLGQLNAPLVFAPTGGAGYFEKQGWKTVELRTVMDEARRLNREIFLARLWRVFGACSPKRIQDLFKKTSGYLLLGKS